ncbi:MAG: hypothetical protein GPW19_03040 [Euryarchaeota archaeon]|nr:hypothetical protein [Euryarchaeota archaeon]
MSVEIKIDVTDYSNYNFFRFVNIKIGSRSYVPLFPTINSKVKIREGMVQGYPEGEFVECYLKITKDQLNEMDSDREKQKKFIEGNFARVYGENLLIIPKILLREGETLTETEMRYLVDILYFPGNIIHVAPLFYYYDLTEKGKVSIKNPVNSYKFFQLTEEFLNELRNNSINAVGLMVQPSLSRTDVRNLLNLYRDFSTPISIVDFSGRSTIDTYLILQPLLREPESYNLTQKHGENYILYSFDSKPYSGRGDIVPAINVLRYDMGFSTFGPRHTNKYNAKDRPKHPLGQENEPYVPKIFYKGHYSYSKPNLDFIKRNFLSWLESNGLEITDNYEDYVKYVKKYHKDYEYENFINSILEMKEAASGNGIDNLLGNVNEVNNIIKKIKKNNRQLGIGLQNL